MKLENYRATKLSYENRIEGGAKKLQVTQKFNTRVNYLPDNRIVCMYEVEISAADDLPFNITAEVTGFFSYEEGMSKVEIHVEATRLLFPYLKTSVAMLTSLAGAPQFFIQDHVVRPEDIVGHTKEPVKGVN